jgi:hypothetical protein
MFERRIRQNNDWVCHHDSVVNIAILLSTVHQIKNIFLLLVDGVLFQIDVTFPLDDILIIKYANRVSLIRHSDISLIEKLCELHFYWLGEIRQNYVNPKLVYVLDKEYVLWGAIQQDQPVIFVIVYTLYLMKEYGESSLRLVMIFQIAVSDVS